MGLAPSGQRATGYDETLVQQQTVKRIPTACVRPSEDGGPLDFDLTLVGTPAWPPMCAPHEAEQPEGLRSVRRHLP